MKTLITGATGFIGGYLAQFLCHQGDEVCGTYYPKHKGKSSEKDSPQNFRLVRCDIRDAEAIDAIIAKEKPQRIYHLAAQSLPTLSWQEPTLTFETNVIGTINLFNSVLRQGLKPRILVACSSAEYGFVSEDEIPVTEEHPLKPLHPYGVSKVAQDLLAYQYFVNFNLPVIRVRFFNTIGPGKINDVCSDFAIKIARIKKGILLPPLKVGNLKSKRDFTDVRDAVEGMYLALEKGEDGEVYNLCSSRAVQISEVLGILLNLAGQNVSVEVDKKLLRPSDEPIIMGANDKLRERTGWEPLVSIEKTLGDMLDYWCKKNNIER